MNTTLRKKIKQDDFSFEPLSMSQFCELMRNTDEIEFAQAFFDKSGKLFRYAHVVDDSKIDYDKLNIAYALAINKANAVIENTKDIDLIDWNFVTDPMFDVIKREPADGLLRKAFKKYLTIANDKCKDRVALKRLIDGFF